MSSITDHYRIAKQKQISKGKSSAVPSKTSPSDRDKLRKFDLDHNYGPSTGITRLERWERAEKFGLNPPNDIKQLILRHDNDPEYSESVWNDYKQIL